MSTAAIWSDEDKTQEAISRAVKERQEFGRWWWENADQNIVDVAALRELAFVAWKAGRRSQ
jgi:hypothetical protein